MLELRYIMNWKEKKKCFHQQTDILFFLTSLHWLLKRQLPDTRICSSPSDPPVGFRTAIYLFIFWGLGIFMAFLCRLMGASERISGYFGGYFEWPSWICILQILFNIVASLKIVISHHHVSDKYNSGLSQHLSGNWCLERPSARMVCMQWPLSHISYQQDY